MELDVAPGWSEDYYYISDYLKERILEAKVTKVVGGFENKFRGEIHFSDGTIITWFEDSEGPNISLKEDVDGKK